jgi:hypothetical protein
MAYGMKFTIILIVSVFFFSFEIVSSCKVLLRFIIGCLIVFIMVRMCVPPGAKVVMAIQTVGKVSE